MSALSKAEWQHVPPAMPIIALAFVFQNVVPVLCSSLEGDRSKIRTAIVSGCAVPWAMFLLWNACVLGSTAVAESGTTSAMDGMVDPLSLVRSSGPVASTLVDAFSLLAITTSYIGFVLGLTQFFAECLDKKSVGNETQLPYAITLIPPLICAMAFPDIFYNALSYAGTYGVLTLFGLVPACMAWNARYGNATLSTLRIAPDGRGVLVGMIALGAAVISEQIIFPPSP